MARPRKEGLDYFPLDVNFFDSVPIRRIKMACGPSSVSAIISLLSRIYSNGYFIEWTADMPFLIAESIGISEGAANEIVKKAVQIGYFDASLYQKFAILTNREIQEVFLEATKKRTGKNTINDDYLIPEVLAPDNVSVSETRVFESKTAISNTENEQSKVKKTKKPLIVPDEERAKSTVVEHELVEFYNRECSQMPPIANIDKRTRARLAVLVSRHSRPWLLNALKKAASSPFVNGTGEGVRFSKPFSWVVANLENIDAGQYDLPRMNNHEKTMAAVRQLDRELASQEAAKLRAKEVLEEITTRMREAWHRSGHSVEEWIEAGCQRIAENKAEEKLRSEGIIWKF